MRKLNNRILKIQEEHGEFVTYCHAWLDGGNVVALEPFKVDMQGTRNFMNRISGAELSSLEYELEVYDHNDEIIDILEGGK